MAKFSAPRFLSMTQRIFTPGMFAGCSAGTSSGRKISMVATSIVAVPPVGDCPLFVFDSFGLYDAPKSAPGGAFDGTVSDWQLIPFLSVLMVIISDFILRQLHPACQQVPHELARRSNHFTGGLLDMCDDTAG